MTETSNTYIAPFFAVIFGGDGDLSKRKILPAFYNRWDDGQLDMPFQILCISRSQENATQFKKELRPFIESSIPEGGEDRIDSFFERIELVHIPEISEKNVASLSKKIKAEPDWQRTFYLSVPSAAFNEICTVLKSSGLVNENSKVVLEKPLGHNLASSNEINTSILKAFGERQIFRIDHYLGKETVQNLMVLRFANHLFERSWNAENIDNVQITVAESLGVEKRADYYDKTGALLDMVQNHLLQLLCLVAMEPPSTLTADSVRNEKLKVLESLRVFNKSELKNNVIRGQYSRGTVGEEKVKSYLEDIRQFESETETFVALRVFIDNWRWKDVPFYLRTGKRMKRRYSDIVINFKPVRHNIFSDVEKIPANRLIIRLQPDERIELVQLSKIPGPGGYRFKPISLKLDFVDSFKQRMPEAYERLIIDILRGNQTLFMRYDELESAWKWIESISRYWHDETRLVLYDSGSWGPGYEIMDESTKWQAK